MVCSHPARIYDKCLTHSLKPSTSSRSVLISGSKSPRPPSSICEGSTLRTAIAVGLYTSSEAKCTQLRLQRRNRCTSRRGGLRICRSQSRRDGHAHQSSRNRSARYFQWCVRIILNAGILLKSIPFTEYGITAFPSDSTKLAEMEFCMYYLPSILRTNLCNLFGQTS